MPHQADLNRFYKDRSQVVQFQLGDFAFNFKQIINYSVWMDLTTRRLLTESGIIYQELQLTGLLEDKDCQAKQAMKLLDTDTPYDMAPAVELPGSGEGVRVIQFPHNGH